MRAWLQCVTHARMCAFVITALTIASVCPPGLLAATASVDLSGVRQTIRGFGGASAWLGQLTDAEMNTLFGSGPGTVGLSIIRLRIAPDRNWNDELQNARKATARGVIVMATPWTPPASMKTNNNVVGGSLKTSEFANYANYLNSFVSFLASNGAPLYAISVQNEPDINSANSVTQTFSVTGGAAPATFNRYRTSGGENLATLSPIIVSGGSFTTSLPGQSITSFVSP
jgi:O-glycosyl hydrolase